MKFSSAITLKAFIPVLPALAVCLASMHLFIELTDEMLEKDLVHFDHFFTVLALKYHSEDLTSIFTVITWFGDRYVYIALSGLFFIFYYYTHQTKREALLLAIVSLSGFLTNLLLKWYFQRPRPVTAGDASFYSYPSGHSMSSVIFYGFIIYVIWHEELPVTLKILFSLGLGLLILLVGTSRVYLGVHYASDVAAGFLGGLFWLFLFVAFLKFFKIRVA